MKHERIRSRCNHLRHLHPPGQLRGVIASSRLTQYRLAALEKQVNRHNQVIERTFRLEGRMDECEHDIRDLKASRHP